ncbi:syntaxin binding protein 1 [Glugoides intestinalis]
MDLRKLHKQKIIDEVLKSFEGTWSVIIYDSITVHIINSLFKKSDLLDFGITAMFSIVDERPTWDMPAIYFLNCTRGISKQINQENNEKKYSAIRVFSLTEPEGLDKLIKYKVIHTQINILEERIFKCEWSNILSLSSILNCKLNVTCIECTTDLAQKMVNILKKQQEYEVEATLLVLDRTVDLFSPLMFFFSFRTILREISTVDCSDDYYKEIRNKHLGEISDYLQSSVLRIQERLQRLGNKNVGFEELDKLVLEAPKNIELKKNIEKYSDYLKLCFKKLETVKELVDAQQNLVLEKDENGEKLCISLDTFFNHLISPSLSIDDRVALLFLLKVKGIQFTDTEANLLKANGFTDDDIKVMFNRRNQVLRTKERLYKYNISRYEPALVDIIESFTKGQGVFKALSEEKPRIGSLRKSTMICSEKQPRRIICVYVKNGLCIEELRIAYSLSESLGIEVMLGGDKILTKRLFVEEYRKNKELQETSFVKG